jgi:hypothetical protein
MIEDAEAADKDFANWVARLSEAKSWEEFDKLAITGKWLFYPHLISGKSFDPLLWAPKSTSRKCQIIVPKTIEFAASQPIWTESNARFVESIARARRWLNHLTSDEAADTKTIALCEGCSERSVRMTISLAFLNPVIVKRAIENRLPHGLGVSVLTDLPADWKLQAEVIS